MPLCTARIYLRGTAPAPRRKFRAWWGCVRCAHISGPDGKKAEENLISTQRAELMHIITLGFSIFVISSAESSVGAQPPAPPPTPPYYIAQQQPAWWRHQAKSALAVLLRPSDDYRMHIHWAPQSASHQFGGKIASSKVPASWSDKCFNEAYFIDCN